MSTSPREDTRNLDLRWWSREASSASTRLLHIAASTSEPVCHLRSLTNKSEPYTGRAASQPEDFRSTRRGSVLFSLVNIGVRGSEPIRNRVVQAGTLDVVGCVRVGWLAWKGFAVRPSASASDLPRESREQLVLRWRLRTQQRRREREHAQEVARLLALERQLANVEEYGDDENMTKPR